MLPRIAWYALAGAVLFQFVPAHAAPTTYVVNRSVGNAGTLIGTIETDGTIGTLQQGNVLDWNLTLNADSDATTLGRLLGPLSGGNSAFNFFPASALSTALDGLTNTLSFNFGTPLSEIFQIATVDNSVVWQMQAGMPFSDELLRESAVVPWQPIQTFAPQGPVSVVLGTASAGDAGGTVPEPSTVLMSLLGIAGVLGSRTRKVTESSLGTVSS